MSRILEIAYDTGYACAFYPALVRCNPNIPFKTRGNGAVVLRIHPPTSSGDDADRVIGRIGDDSLKMRPGPAESGDATLDMELFKELCSLVEEESHRDRSGTEPGIVLTRDHFSLTHYFKAVRSIYPLEEAVALLESNENTLYRRFGKGRGIVGCIGALSWYQNFRKEGWDRTYELLTYRRKERWGKDREIDIEKVRELDRDLSATFNNYDPINEKALIYPNSPCPVLFGVRGDDPEELLRALDVLDCGEMERWQLLVTNQGTDDHLISKRIGDIRNFTSVITEGTVAEPPRTIRGGHVFFTMEDEGEGILASAFEPTKSFRDVVRELVPGDRVRLYGGVRAKNKGSRPSSGNNGGAGKVREDLCLNIEKMEILVLTPTKLKVGNPVCPSCQRKMGSVGKEQGYRCRKCHEKAGEDEANYKPVKRSLRAGAIYEVDGVARRHLSKSVERMKGKLVKRPGRG